MSAIHRICPACGKDTPLEARHCPHCGRDTQSDLPVPQNSNLPVVVGKAALPVLAGIGALAVRMAWKLLQSRWAAPVSVETPTKITPVAPTQPAQQRRRTIRIRSSWAVGDSHGVVRQGSSEHIIEIDD
jgi:hypothetical protein